MDSEKVFQSVMIVALILAAMVGVVWAGYYYQQQQAYSQPERAYLQGYSDGASDGFAAIVQMNQEDERQDTIRLLGAMLIAGGLFCVGAIAWLAVRVLQPGKAGGNG